MPCVPYKHPKTNQSYKLNPNNVMYYKKLNIKLPIFGINNRLFSFTTFNHFNSMSKLVLISLINFSSEPQVSFS